MVVHSLTKFISGASGKLGWLSAILLLLLLRDQLCCSKPPLWRVAVELPVASP